MDQPSTEQEHAAWRVREHATTLGPAGPTYEQIAQRAYELWKARGGQGGSAEEDWLQAERELRLGGLYS